MVELWLKIIEIGMLGPQSWFELSWISTDKRHTRSIIGNFWRQAFPGNWLHWYLQTQKITKKHAPANKHNILVYLPFMTSGQEMEQTYSYNPGARMASKHIQESRVAFHTVCPALFWTHIWLLFRQLILYDYQVSAGKAAPPKVDKKTTDWMS